MLKSSLVWPNPNLQGINNNGHIYLVTDLFVNQYISDKHSLNTNCNINQSIPLLQTVTQGNLKITLNYRPTLQ